MINFDKPVQTISGKSVKIIYKNRSGDYPIVALVGLGEAPYLYDRGGKFYEALDEEYNLINIPEETVTWGVYMDGIYLKNFKGDRSAAIRYIETTFGKFYLIKITHIDNKLVKMEIVESTQA